MNPIILSVTKNIPIDTLNTYPTLASALAALPADSSIPALIRLEPGIYTEKLDIRRSNLTIEGTGSAPAETVIEYGDYALDLMPDGTKRGTFRSYTVFLDGNGNTLANLTIRNTAYPRRKAGQALALYADGDRLLVKDCRLESYQDTLFTGPLPPSELQPGGFTGPKRDAPRIVGHQEYRDCVICGDIDFIFGSAVAYFDRCDIVSRNGYTPEELSAGKAKDGIYGYATAASTPEGCPYGYVFESCNFLSDGCPPESVYLGRPWRNYAKTVLLRCELGAHIRREGFHDWNKPEAHGTIFYAEYKNSGPGAELSGRAEFVRHLSDAEASRYAREKVLGCDLPE